MRRLFPVASLVLLGMLAAPVSGCQSVLGMSAPDMPSPDGWVESDPFECVDFDLLWDTCKLRASRQGFRIDDDATSYTRRMVVTTWKTDLALRANEGRRMRRFVEVTTMKDRENWYIVRAATVRQRNEDVSDPLNPLTAKWKDADPDPEDAERVAFLVANAFREFGPSKEFDDR